MGATSRILVGRFGAPHGVRGELRLQSFTQDPTAIGRYGPLASVDGQSFSLTALRHLKDSMFVVRVAGVADRAAAEALARTELFIERTALPSAEEEEFYVADLIGLAAVDAKGRDLGTIVDMPNYGGGDLIEIRPAPGAETRLFPFTREVVPTIDLVAKRVVVMPPDEVEAHEDGRDHEPTRSGH